MGPVSLSSERAHDVAERAGDGAVDTLGSGGAGADEALGGVGDSASDDSAGNSAGNGEQSGDDSAAISIGINQSTAVQLSAFYAISVLTEGVDPGSLPVGVVTPPDLAINFRVARQIGLRIPFRFMEAATFIYNYDGRQVRAFGQPVGYIN